MASEHTLSLKAVLDTSDVQQKLNLLKQQQQSGENGPAGGGIQQALMRLNTSIQNLQHAIEKLAGAQGNPANSTGANRMPPLVPPNRLPSGGRPLPPKQQSSLVSPLGLGKNLRIQQRQLVEAFGLGKGSPARQMEPVVREWRNFQKRGWTGKKLWNRLDSFDDYSMVEEWQQAQGSANLFLNRINNLRRRQVANNPTIAKEKAMRTSAASGASGARMSPRMRANLRMGAGLAFGTIAGGVESYAQATRNQDLATGARFVLGIGYGAATGAMIGGPVGAGIGAATGLLTSAFEELARSAKESAEALEQQSKSVVSSQGVDNKLFNYFRDQNDKKALEKNNVGYFNKQYREAKELYDRTEKKLKEEVGLGGEGLKRFNLREYSQETKRLMELKGKDDEEVKRRLKVEKVYAANADVLMEAGQRRDEMKETLQKLTSPGADWETGLPKMKDRWAAPGLGKIRDWFDPEIRYLKKQSHYYDEFGVKHESKEQYSDSEWWQIVQGKTIAQGRASAAKDAIALLKETLDGMKAPDMSPVNSLASLGFMIGNGSEDDNLLNETNKYLNEIAHLTREIKDKEGEAAIYS